jgi:hypothetical protein
LRLRVGGSCSCFASAASSLARRAAARFSASAASRAMRRAVRSAITASSIGGLLRYLASDALFARAAASCRC